MPDARPTGKAETIIAFDYGTRRIGVAVGQTITGSASPLGIIENGSDGPCQPKIAELLREWRPDRLVVGMPFHADGRHSDMGDAVNEFIGDLKRYALHIVTIDERHSSRAAEQLLKSARQAGSHGKIRKEHIDAAAAVLIAERYLRDPQLASVVTGSGDD